MDTSKLVWISVAAGTFAVGVAGVIYVRGKLLERLKLKTESPEARASFEAYSKASSEAYSKAYSLQFCEFVFSGLIVLGLTIFFGEVGILSDYFHKQVARHFTDIIVNPKYLRETFNVPRIKEFRVTATKALCGPDLEEGPGTYLDLIENTLYPMIDSVRRYNLEVYYTLEPKKEIEKKAGKRVSKVRQISSWVYTNPAPRPITFVQTIQARMDSIVGEDTDNLLKVTKFLVKRDTIVDTIPITLTKERMSDGRYRFTAKPSFLIKKDVSVTVEQEKVLPYDDVITLWMNVPTKDIKVTFLHPSDIDPRLFVYGLGKNPEGEHVVNEQQLDVWRYDGWLLRMHGILIYWRHEENREALKGKNPSGIE
ncbi:MAG: hypothetical protein MUO91_02540 [candidate division Zixibacteria bacterium]|nr:hypothetical protein [candidate division Zixibacteria bacterium]